LNQKLKIFSFVSFLILANTPLAFCMASETIIYLSENESGNFTCDGIDDHIQINEALQLVAENSTYTTVYLKGPFTYSINDTLLIGSNTTLEGDSNATIKLVNNANWETSKPLIMERNLNSRNITIRDFSIDGNREGNTNVISGKGYYNLIHLSYCKNISVYDMSLANNHGDGLKTDSCSDIKYYDNTMYGLGHDCLYASSCSNIEAYNNTISCRTNSGLRLYNSNHAKFYNNTITSDGSGGSGIEIQKYGTPAMNDIEVYNNKIYRTALAGIWIFGSGPSYSLSSANVSVHHNQIYNTGTKTSSPITGGIVSGGFNILAENNVFDGCYGSAISQKETYSTIPGSGYVITARNNIITNTRFSSAGGGAYGVYNLLTGTHFFVLQNNCLYNNSGGDFQGSQTSPSNIEVCPEYADKSKNDYHLKSKAGRWNGSSWINDSISSPCIDAGYKYSDYFEEPEDNGNRVNMGAYGNTNYASKSGNLTKNNAKGPDFIEIPITTNESDQRDPVIYGDRIVWSDNRNGNEDVYTYDLSTSKETLITTNESWASSPIIYGNIIVWQDGRNGYSDIYMYNLLTPSETQITVNESWASNPAIYNDRVIWDDNRNGDCDIYLYNLSTLNETRINTDQSDQVKPAIYGDKIVWQDDRKGNWDIYMYDVLTSNETRITSITSNQILPSIFNDRLVWQDDRNGNSDIYLYNFSTSTETRITTNESDQCDPSIYGDIIVWKDNRDGNSNIYIYNISTNETLFTTNESQQVDPAIFEDRIVWSDERNGDYNIYMCNFSAKQQNPELPVASFTSNVTSGTVPLNIAFTDTSTNSPTSWKWSFGDGTANSTVKNPTHNYSKAGNYTVMLTAGNTAGSNTVAKSSYIKVTPVQKPVAGFTSNVTSGTVPLNVAFTDTSTNSPTSWKWSFGDGTANSTVKSPTHSYSKAGNYTVVLTSTNSAGSNTATKTNYIKVTAVKPVASFSSNVTLGTVPLNVAFTDTSTGTPTTWSWNFGDGTANSTVKNPTHGYSKVGNYTVVLTSTNSAGSSTAAKTNYIKVAAVKPVASFSSNVTSGIVPLNVAFTDTSTNSPTSWKWSFGDGTANSTVKNPTHSYSKAGNYTVILTATNTAGSSTVTKSSYIKVAPVQKPVAGFTSNVTSGTVPLNVAFTDTSTNSPTSWKWSFGDGTANSTLKNPTHKYSTAGNYTVTLTASNSAGSSSVRKSSYIRVAAQKPVANFNSNLNSGTVPLNVAFTDTSTGTPTSWKWSFGDSTANSTVKNPTHSYSKAGNYTVILTAGNSVGSSSVRKSSYIRVAAQKPVANFNSNVTSGTAPLNVGFTDASTGTPTAWKWSFGDGTANSTIKNPAHKYSAAGNYTVILTVSNSAGSSTVKKLIAVKAAATSSQRPIAAFSGSPTSGKVPLKVTFTENSRGSPTSWAWNFGDGATSSTRNASHTYTKKGRFTVTLTVRNASGSNTKTASRYITVT